jgi:hypothetical protein
MSCCDLDLLLSPADLERNGVPIDLHWDILKLGIPSRNRRAIWDRTVRYSSPDGRLQAALGRGRRAATTARLVAGGPGQGGLP